MEIALLDANCFFQFNFSAFFNGFYNKEFSYFSFSFFKNTPSLIPSAFRPLNPFNLSLNALKCVRTRLISGLHSSET